MHMRKGKAQKRSALLCCLLQGVLAILILAGFRPPFPPLEPEGLLIDFGFDESGSGKIESASRISAAPQAQNQPVEQKIETQDFQETVTLPEEKRPTSPKRKPRQIPRRIRNLSLIRVKCSTRTSISLTATAPAMVLREEKVTKVI